MEAQVRVTPDLMLKVEGAKQKDLFKAIASAAEVFGERSCGLCGSSDIRITWRTATRVEGKKVETFEYPEYKCLAVHDGKRCGGVLSMGTINDETGTLYPIRKLVNGERPATKDEKKAGNGGTHGTHRGWYRWKGHQEAKDDDAEQKTPF
jgi:hypothetical protein